MQIKERSGNVADSQKIVALLYILMRDDICCGRIEELTKELESCEPPIHFSNGWLAKYAQDVFNRLDSKNTRQPLPLDVILV